MSGLHQRLERNVGIALNIRGECQDGTKDKRGMSGLDGNVRIALKIRGECQDGTKD